MKAIATALLAMIVAPAAAADSPPPVISDAGTPARCTKVLLCQGQTTNGLCTVNNNSLADGQVVSLPAAGYWTHTLYADRSTATGFTCDPETSSLDPTDLGKPGWDFANASLTPSQPVNWWTGGFDRIAVRCTGITGGQVTVVGLHCPMDAR